MRSLLIAKFILLSHSHILFNSYVTRNFAPSKEIITSYDEFGELPQVENTKNAVRRSVSIVVLRSLNATFLGYSTANSSQFEVPLGSRPLNSLINPWQFIFLTGLVGDCRYVTRFARNRVLNYTVSYNHPPTGSYISSEIGNLLQEASSKGGGIRPLACHIFLIDAIDGKIYEIDCTGHVSSVIGGVGGVGANEGYEHLERNVHDELTDELAKNLIISTLAKMANISPDTLFSYNLIKIADRGSS